MMLVETENLVPVEQFRKQLDRYITAARNGQGPIAVVRDNKVIGYFVSPEEYEAVHQAGLMEFLESRLKGPTVSHQAAEAHVRKFLQRRSRKKR